MTTQDRIKFLHDRYCSLTGMNVPLTMQRIYQWEAWVAKGFKEVDLEVTIWLLKQKIKEGRKTLSCLKFHYLIGNLEYFEEDLGEANALKRQPPKESQRQEILRVTGRPEPEPDTCRSAAQILAASQAFEEFKALKSQL